MLAVTRRWRSARGEGAAAGAIRQAIEELERLNKSSEQDFLAVGEKLMEFGTSARRISSDISGVTALIAGEGGRNTSRALEKLLEYSREIDARMELSGQAFSSVLDLAKRVRQAFSGLTNMVAVFRSLCTLTQIETARLGGAGADLGHLASEIRPLSENIQASGEAVVASSNRLGEAVERAARQVSELRTTQLKEMPVLIARALEGLRSFEERRRLAAEASRRQASEYQALCGAIDDLVGSIQFHDITRQQVEHVIEALRKIGAGLAASNAGVGSGEARTILLLQSSQLGEAARLFTGSVERMDRSLETIGGRIQNASQAVREVAGVSSDGGDSFFAKMETEFGAIGKMLARCTAAQAEIEAAATGLGDTLSSMRASVFEIRGTELQIQRISTNATIRATHIAGLGVALNKIAEVMRRLALDSNASTEQASEALEAMQEAFGRIARPESGREGEDEGKGAGSRVAADLQRALAELHSSSEASAERVDNIAKLGAQLAGEIGVLRARMSVGRVFADVAAQVRARLQAAGAEAAARSSDGGADPASQELDHLAQTYTMQRQRDVHEAVVGGAAGASPQADSTPVSGSGDFGENIELF